MKQLVKCLYFTLCDTPSTPRSCDTNLWLMNSDACSICATSTLAHQFCTTLHFHPSLIFVSGSTLHNRALVSPIASEFSSLTLVL